MPTKSNIQVSKLKGNFYARWRSQEGSITQLRETPGAMPAESLLQAIWQHQRVLRDQLTTLDGKPVRILHPGFRSFSSGPDFRNSIVQIGQEPARTGDVEVDLHTSGWCAHGHDRNPEFRSVILQVVWDGDIPAGRTIPVVALKARLDASLAELGEALGREPVAALPESLQGRCCSPLRDFTTEKLGQLLHEAAEVRRRLKADYFRSRARQVGWEQALWEGLFRALGYKQNVWPMHTLAEARNRWLGGRPSNSLLQARLMGISGLLPDQPTRRQESADSSLRRIWDQWWRERDQFEDCLIPKAAWRLNGIRPANHPQRRLALAAHWLNDATLLPRLEKWFSSEMPDMELADSLLKVFQVDEDEFWSWHWSLRSERMPRAQPLLGVARVTDLAVNVVLPWLWIRALEGGNEALQRVAEQRYFHWPAAEDNSVLRLARRRLLGGMKPGVLRGAASQQGLLQIVRDFCDHSNSLCDNCQFPRLVTEFANYQAA